jgi:hypothetical protein
MSGPSRWSTILVLVAMGSAFLPGQTMAEDTSISDTLDASGIALVGPSPIQVVPQNDREALAFDAALRVALKNRDDMGYPWIDAATNTLQLAAVDDTGIADARAAQTDDLISALPTRITQAAASIAQLDRIGDAVTRLLDAGVPDADLIYRTEPDQQHNRVVITISASSAELMAALAARFGTELIAVRVRGPRPDASGLTRDVDYTPFWGGARFTTASTMCTTGFAWNASGVEAMLTAAHCVSTGGSIYTAAYSGAVGSVRSASEENWLIGSGTQYYSGQSVYRGDVGLIRYTSPFGSQAHIYTGGNGSTTNRVVGQMNSTWAQIGQSVCSSGITTNSWCGTVTDTLVNQWYILDGLGVWARHVDVAEALGPNCPTHGDSGGPMFQTRSDGKVKALGILSGSAPIGVMCEVYFTDIWDSYWGLPGTIKTL